MEIQGLNDALLNYIKNERPYGKSADAIEVTGFEEGIAYGGGCETCSYEYIEVEIFYNTAKGGKTYVYYYDGTFADLINAL